MIDENSVRLHAHRNNVRRYRRLLKTKLTELEHQFIHRRLSEECAAIDRLSASTFVRAASLRPDLPQDGPEPQAGC
jgi:hypothetical protein